MGRLLGVGWGRMGAVSSSWISLCVSVFVSVSVGSICGEDGLYLVRFSMQTD